MYALAGSLRISRHLTYFIQLRAGVSSQIGAAPAVNILEWMGRTALELIGQGGLGYSFDSLVKNTENAFANAIKDFVQASHSFLQDDIY